jgi:lipoyl(octanoyl) transferase
MMVEWIAMPGLTPYEKSLELMEKQVEDILKNNGKETIFLLEHPDIYTAGTSHDPKELLNANDIPVIYTGRGGKFTYHGPGQRVIYPILDLRRPNRIRDIKLYVRNLEQWIINSLAGLGVDTYTIPGKIGIWTKHGGSHAKIAAIGIRVRKWITYHGIAVNICNNLDLYSGIIPCGIDNFPVTSLKKLDVKTTMDHFDFILKREFKKIFQ